MIETLSSSPLWIGEVDACNAAKEYVANELDVALEVVDGDRYHDVSLGREIWRFFLQGEHGPLAPIQVDAKTGDVVPLSASSKRMIRERVAIGRAHADNELPIDEAGYVVLEFARRRANGYLSMDVNLYFSATDGVFIPLARPVWQFAIRLRLPKLGELGIMGTVDVDAQTGDVIRITEKQVQQLRERADAIVKLHTQTAAA